MLEKLKNSGSLTISIVDHSMSKRKAKDKFLRKQCLAALHQPNKIEMKIFRITRRHDKNLKMIFAMTKREKRLNKIQRALFKQRILILVTLQEHLAEVYKSSVQKLGL